MRTHAPVGADASVRPAARANKHERTNNANPHNACRGRCRALPVRGMIVFTIRRGVIGRAQRADRVVRPYRTFFGFADGLCNFAIAFCRRERGIDLYGDFCMAAVRCSFLVVRPAREGQSLSPTQIWSLIAKALYLKTYSPSPHPSAFGCHFPHTGKAFFCAPRKKIRRQLPPDFLCPFAIANVPLTHPERRL